MSVVHELQVGDMYKYKDQVVHSKYRDRERYVEIAEAKFTSQNGRRWSTDREQGSGNRRQVVEWVSS